MVRFRSAVFPLLFTVLLLAAAAVRFTDLTDLPLDFNPSRQLYSAIVARAIYFESLPDADPEQLALARAHRAQLEKLEPPILETVVVAGYRLAGGEKPWIARALSITVWLAGSLVVFRIGQKLSGPAGAVVAGLYFLFLPLAIYASRSFQIDSTMVVGFAATIAGLFRWQEDRSWKWAVLTGILAGLSILFKGLGAILLGPALAAGVWSAVSQGRSYGRTLRSLVLDRQVWLMLVLALGPALLYYPGLAGETGSLYSRSIFNRLDEVLTPSFYIRWLILLDRLLYLPVILAAFGSAFLAPLEKRGVLFGLWAGYGLYGLAFPKLIITHDYYQLPLVLIVALSLAPAAELVSNALFKQGWFTYVVFAALILLAAAYPGWIARSVLLAEDHRDSAAYWETVGKAIPTDGRAIGYSQDYGFQLMYYGGRAIGILPEQISSERFQRDFDGADYFVVTAKNQMSPELSAYLEATYPIVESGGGFVVYDLQP